MSELLTDRELQEKVVFLAGRIGSVQQQLDSQPDRRDFDRLGARVTKLEIHHELVKWWRGAARVVGIIMAIAAVYLLASYLSTHLTWH
jgi:hypothetical protein